MIRETVSHLRDLPRYRQILAALVHYGYQDVLSALNLEGLSRPIEWVARNEPPPPERHKRARLLCEDLGPTFVKLGQVLSTRPDLLPEAYIAELSQLRDNVAPFPSDDAETILVEEHGRPPSETFAEFDREPVASASISQVHRARLHDGSLVAVKIRRPNIEKTVQADLDILKHLAELAEKRLPMLKPYGPLNLAREFERSLRKELDLSIERRTMERSGSQFQGDPDCVVPRVYPELCTQRVLVMDFIDGARVDDLDVLRRMGIDAKRLATRGARVYLKQIFRFGLFHADPHPGNLKILKDGRIALLDYGMFGFLDWTARERIADLLSGLMAQDPDQVLRALDDLNVKGEDVDVGALRRDMSELVAAYADLTLQNIDLKHLLGELTAIIRTHRLRLPPDLVLLIRGLITIDSLGRMLDPQFDIAAQLRPFLRRMAANRYGPSRLLNLSVRTSRDLQRIATLLPDILSGSLESMRKGELNLKFDLQHFDNMVKQLVRASNTLAVGVVLAGLLVASASLIQTQGFSTLGRGGLLGASVLAVWLLWYMSRRS